MKADTKRATRIDVDLLAIRKNTQTMAKQMAPAVICGVVKANGYGHGAIPSARAMIGGGATMLAVVRPDEGVELRRGGIEVPILLLSEPPLDSFQQVFASNLTPSLSGIAGVKAAGKAATRPQTVHVRVDTGLRLGGVVPEDLPALLAELQQHKNLTLEGIFSHVGAAGLGSDDGKRICQERIDQFTEAVSTATHIMGKEPPLVHLANGLTGLVHKSTRLSMVRLGGTLYGVMPQMHPDQAQLMTGPASLETALKLRSSVASITSVQIHERPSYGMKREIQRGKIASVPIGYGDGFARELFDGNQQVLIRGRRFRLAGAVAMDQILVEIGQHQVEVGDEVVLIGQQGQQKITVQEWADNSRTVPLEVLCRLGNRIPRYY